MTPSNLMRNVLMRAADIYAAEPRSVGCLALEAAFGSADDGAREAAMVLVERTRDALTERFAALRSEGAQAQADAVLIALRGMPCEARAGKSVEDLRKAVEYLLTQ